MGLIAAAADFGGAVLASVSAGVLYHQFTFGRAGDLVEFAALGAVMASVFVPVMQNRSAYVVQRLIDFGAQIAPIVVLWFAVLLFMIGMGFAFKVSADFSRGTIMLLALVGPMVILCQRYFLVRYASRALDRGRLHRRRALLIVEEAGREKATELARRSGFSVERVLTVAPSDADFGAAAERALDIIRGSDIEEIHISVSWARWPAVKAMLWKLEATPLPVRLLPDTVAAEVLGHPQIDLAGAFAFELRREPLSAAERLLKRTIDIIGSGLGLFALGPLMLFVAAAIRVDSPGPILFRQVRNGFNGRPFRILKFRTMSVMEDGATVTQAKRNDARVTRVGCWLRCTSIDELPQLLNVLRGDMSLVGPRPHALAHDSEYMQAITKYAHRHKVKPGMTGWAQVSGFRGETADLAMMERRVELDLWYIANWSSLLDLWILVRTCLEVVRARNAF